MATVRYVSETSGVIVRKTPAGEIQTALNYGNLMYDIPDVEHEYATLGGENYEWVKVYYYRVGSVKYEDGEVSEGTGWVALKLTTELSRDNYPGKYQTYSSVSNLNQYQQLVNAWYIYNYLIEFDWSANAIYAMLGNMEVESTINPGKWQSLNDTTLGYGLTQWTPATKLINWADANGYDKGDIDTQLKRIEYEVAYGEQWISSKHSPEMTFLEFYQSTKSVSTLAEYFIRCYENPGVIINGTASEQTAAISARQNKALKWSTLLDNLV